MIPTGNPVPIHWDIPHNCKAGNVRHCYINYWAAQALLSRVYLNMGEYQKAYDAATDVIKNNGGRYQLYSYEEYPNVWGQDFQSESLFELYITLSEPSGGTGGEGAPMVYEIGRAHV